MKDIYRARPKGDASINTNSEEFFAKEIIIVQINNTLIIYTFFKKLLLFPIPFVNFTQVPKSKNYHTFHSHE